MGKPSTPTATTRYHRPGRSRTPSWTVADRLRKARELTGLDQESFARVLGVSRGTVSNYERSRTTHRQPGVVKAWALATGVPFRWLQDTEPHRTLA